MPEYMDYDDVNPNRTKKQVILSRIGVTLSVLFIAACVIRVFFFSPKNVRTDFATVTGKAHSINEAADTAENEFLKLNEFLNTTESARLDDDFKKRFPETAKMLCFNKKQLTKQAVYSFDIGGCFVVARPYILNQDNDNKQDAENPEVKGVIGVDFACFEYCFEGGVKVNAMQRFSLRYHNSKEDAIPYIVGEYVPGDEFKLNCYSLTVNISCEKELPSVNCKTELTEGINKAEEKAQSWKNKLSVVDSVSAFKVVSGGKRGDKSVECLAKFNGTAKDIRVKLTFDDMVFNKFKSLTVSPESKNYTYSLSVN